MDIEQAEETSLLLLGMSATLNRQLLRLEPNMEHAEFRALCLRFGNIMGEMLTEGMNPLYQQFPRLKPKEMGGPYPVAFSETPEAVLANKAKPDASPG